MLTFVIIVIISQVRPSQVAFGETTVTTFGNNGTSTKLIIFIPTVLYSQMSTTTTTTTTTATTTTTTSISLSTSSTTTTLVAYLSNFAIAPPSTTTADKFTLSSITTSAPSPNTEVSSSTDQETTIFSTPEIFTSPPLPNQNNKTDQTPASTTMASSINTSSKIGNPKSYQVTGIIVIGSLLAASGLIAITTYCGFKRYRQRQGHKSLNRQEAALAAFVNRCYAHDELIGMDQQTECANFQQPSGPVNDVLLVF